MLPKASSSSQLWPRICCAGAKPEMTSAYAISALLLNRVALTFGLVALLWIVADFFLPGFGAFGHLRYMVELASIMGIAAAGQTLVVIGGGIDLSIASIITFTAVIMPLVSPSFDDTGLIGVATTLVMALAVGAFNGLGIVFLRVHPLILTLATATILQGMLLLIVGGSAISTTNPAVIWLANGAILGVPMTIITWVIVSAATVTLLNRTVLGRWLFAIGTNEWASRLSGANVRGATIAAYALSGFFAGAAGLLLLGMNRQGSVGIGEPYLLGSIAAVVLGGTSILGGRGSYIGTIAGSLLLITLTALITVVNTQPGWRSILFGALILLLIFTARERVED
jgi:ribose transport system permease protein